MNIAASLASGYTSTQIINFLIQTLPHLGARIAFAQKMGHDANSILNMISPLGYDGLKKLDRKVSNSSNPLLNAGIATKQSSAMTQEPELARKAAMGIIGLGAGYGLSQMGGGGMQQPQAPTPQAPMSTATVPSQLGSPNPPAGTAPIQPQGGGTLMPQGGPMAGSPQPQETQGVLPSPAIQQAAAAQIPEINKTKAKDIFDQMGVSEQIDQLRFAGNDPKTIATMLENFTLKPQQKKYLEKLTQEPVEKLVSEYFGDVPQIKGREQFQGKQPNIETQQPIEQPQAPPPIEQPVARTAPQIQREEGLPYAEAAAKQDLEKAKRLIKLAPKKGSGTLKKFKNGDFVNTPSGEGVIKSTSPENAIVEIDGKNKQFKLDNLTTSEKVKSIGKDAVLKNGEVGSIESIKNGIANVKVNGKIKPEKLQDLDIEPEGTENFVRNMVKSIPEKDRSTALQYAVHVPIPNINMMVTRFYNGKVAWYLDVDPDLYKNIALGTYKPKGQAITGMGEYSPEIIDSRGAGFHKEIVSNPKYGKDQKGITWGYADSDYDLLDSIQDILHRISKERYDKEGNLISPKPRSTKKS